MAAMAVDAGAPAAVKERLEAFAGEVLAAAMNRPVQRVNGGLYVRGLLEQGARKSLEPIVERLAGDADYQSMQLENSLSASRNFRTPCSGVCRRRLNWAFPRPIQQGPKDSHKRQTKLKESRQHRAATRARQQSPR